MQIMISFKITDEWISDVMTTALEGGSNYWIADIINTNTNPQTHYFSKNLALGDTLIVLDNEDFEEHKLTKEIFAEGFKMYVEHCLEKGRTVYTSPIDIDGCIADEILQYAIFKEVVFG